MDVALVQLDSGERGFLLRGETYFDQYGHYRKVLVYRLDLLCKLIPTAPHNFHWRGEISHLINSKLAEMDSTITLSRTGQIKDALILVQADFGLQSTNQIEKFLVLSAADKN
jgi:CHASE3 domain sensor protein